VTEGVLLQWSAPTKTYGLPIDYYTVYLSTDNGQYWSAEADGNYSESDASPLEPTAVIDRGCGAAQSCMYKVLAFTAAGSSGPSNLATVANQVPSPPTGLSAQRVPSGVLLQWSTPAKTYGLPIDYYTVYLSTDNGQYWSAEADGNYSESDASPLEPTAVIDRGCGAAQSCMYKVLAFTAAGSSGPSNLATVANQVPSPPTGLSAQRVTEGVLLQWSAPTKTYGLPIDYYTVYLSTDNGQYWSAEADGNYSESDASPLEPTAVIDRGCGAAQSCMYKVLAFTAAGSSGPSNLATVANQVPSPPTGLSAQRVPSGVLLQWSTPAKTYGLPIDYYTVYLSTDNGQYWSAEADGNYSESDASPLEPTAVIDRGCGAAKSCLYNVLAFTAAGSSGPSNLGPRSDNKGYDGVEEVYR
jgi:hypothetical protein